MQVRMLWVLFLTILLVPLESFAQKSNDLTRLRYQRAQQESETVIGESGRLDDPLAVVIVRAKAASLVWRYDNKKARELFLAIWKYIDQQKNDSFNSEEARTIFLKYLYPKDSNLATRLLKELAEKNKGAEASLQSQVTGADPALRRLINLSQGLVDLDPSLAARLLEQSLLVSVTPGALPILLRLREKNPILANYVVSRTLEHFKSRPTILALAGLHLLTEYVFLLETSLAEASEVFASDDALHFQYFSTAYETLKRSLDESDSFLKKERRYTENDLRFRVIYQGQISIILLALAPRYGPLLVGELTQIARRFSGTLPAGAVEMSRMLLSRLKGEPVDSENPDTQIASAIASREFELARRLIDRIEDEAKRKAFLQLLAKAEFQARLEESDFSEAMNIARRIENENLRVLLYLQVAKAAHRKDDVTLSRFVVSEARTALANGEKDGLRARILLSFAADVAPISDSDATDLLYSAVSMINSLPKSTSEKEATGKTSSTLSGFNLNDPGSLTDSYDLYRAFTSVAQIDFDGTLITAGRLSPLPVQMMARLETAEIALSPSPKKNVTAPAKKVPELRTP